MSKPNLVLLPGWGVNSRVWDSVTGPLREAFELTTLDLMGYGSQFDQTGVSDVHALADDVLQRAPASAMWCGWSLGGMIAMVAASQQPQRITRLALVNTTPYFMVDDGWTCGSSEILVANMARQFEANYAKALSRFFLLQFGTAADARPRSRSVANDVLSEPRASWATLQAGLKLLRTTDLRSQLSSVQTETLVMVGREDRVIPPAAGRFLADQISDATLAEVDAGHVPFLTSPEWFGEQLQQFSGASN